MNEKKIEVNSPYQTYTHELGTYHLRKKKMKEWSRPDGLLNNRRVPNLIPREVLPDPKFPPELMKEIRARNKKIQDCILRSPRSSRSKDKIDVMVASDTSDGRRMDHSQESEKRNFEIKLMDYQNKRRNYGNPKESIILSIEDINDEDESQAFDTPSYKILQKELNAFETPQHFKDSP